MDNYFILLGLSFDPIENDETVIREAIDKKRQQWQSELRNPRKQAQAKQAIASIPEIEKTMFDEASRKEEASKAKKSFQKHVNDLKNEILLVSMKGFVTEDELADLIKKYDEFGISEEAIRENIPVPIGAEEEPMELEEIQSISDDEASQLEVYFSNLNLDDMSIYEHYGLPTDCPVSDVIYAANEVLSKILQKGNKDLSDDMEQKIAGLIISIFEENDFGYDNYLSGFRYRKLNNFIETAVGANRTLTSRIFSALIRISMNEYPSMDRVQAAQYIVNHCMIKKYAISPETITELNNIVNESQVEESIDDLIEPEYIEIDTSKIEELEPEPQPQPQQTQQDDTVNILNQMITPYHSIIVSYKNKVSQMASLIKQYQQKRLESGSAMSTGTTCLLFAMFALNIIIAISLFIIREYVKVNTFNIIMLAVSAANIGIGIFGFVTVLPPFQKWREMCSFEKRIQAAETNITSKYKEFADLSFRLLLVETDKITSELNRIQTSIESSFDDAKKSYTRYLDVSKKYIQKDYTSKVILASIALIIASVVILFLAFNL